jgi:hypothetical protein
MFIIVGGVGQSCVNLNRFSDNSFGLCLVMVDKRMLGMIGGTNVGPLGNVISTRDIYRPGFSITSSVADLFVEGLWVLPNVWGSKYPII